MTAKPNHPPTPRPNAFSLIEILVTISIIGLLVGISVFAMAKVRDQAKRQATIAALQGCANALAEYKAQTGLSPSAGTGDIDDLVTELLASNIADVRNIIAAIGTDTTDDGNPDTILDGWENTIHYVRMNDASGTYPRHRQAFFASPGPDKNFGDDEDNVYSFELD